MIERILETKRHEVQGLRKRRIGLRKKPLVPVAFDGELNILAELKRRSPSAGFLGEIGPDRIRIYSKYAKVISVLTDSAYFGGSPEFLEEVALQTHLPVLCKDFIIDPVQIDQAYAFGADIILLIVRILSKDELVTLYRHAQDIGLACLVELHAREEMERLGAIDAQMVGVNARDLDTLQLDLDRAGDMLSLVRTPMRIAESGIRSRQDIERFKAANGFLIGETLMRSKDLEATFLELLHG